MTARTVIQSMLGATLSLSATLPASYDAAGYGATGVIFTEVGEIENFGNHGVTSQVTEFTPVKTGVVAKVKGSKNYGTKSLTMADLPSDAGQVIVDTASESRAHYSAKVQYPAGDGETTGAIHYLDVLVSKAENQDGAVNDVRKYMVDLAICRKPVKVAAT